MQASHAWTQNCYSPAIWYIEESRKIALYSQKKFWHCGRMFMSFKNNFSFLQDGTETWHLVGSLGNWNVIFDGVSVHFKWSICVLLCVVYYLESFLIACFWLCICIWPLKKGDLGENYWKETQSHYLTVEAGTPFPHRLVWEGIIRLGFVTITCAIWNWAFPEF